jgi:S1 RNA binding domain
MKSFNTNHCEVSPEFNGNEEFESITPCDDGDYTLSELILNDSARKADTRDDEDESPSEQFCETTLLSELEELTSIVEPHEGDVSVSLTYPAGEQFPVLSVFNARKKTLDKFEFFATFGGAIKKLTMQRFDEGANHSAWQFLIWDEKTLGQVIEHCEKVALELKLNLNVNKQGLLSRLANVVGPQRKVASTPVKTAKAPQTQVKPVKPQAKPNQAKRTDKPAQPKVVVATPVVPAKPMYQVGEEVVARVTQFKDHGVIITGEKGDGILKYTEWNGFNKGGVDHGSLLVNEGDEISVRVTEVRSNGFAKFTFRSLPDAERHFLSCLLVGKVYDGVIQGRSKYGFHINVGGPVTLFLSNKEVPVDQVDGLKPNQKVQVRFIWLNKEKRIPHASMLNSSKAVPAAPSGTIAA